MQIYMCQMLTQYTIVYTILSCLRGKCKSKMRSMLCWTSVVLMWSEHIQLVPIYSFHIVHVGLSELVLRNQKLHSAKHQMAKNAVIYIIMFLIFCFFACGFKYKCMLMEFKWMCGGPWNTDGDLLVKCITSKKQFYVIAIDIWWSLR